MENKLKDVLVWNLNDKDNSDIEEIKDKVRKVPDFPKKGILFYDFFSLLYNVDLQQKLFNISEKLVRNFMTKYEINIIVGLESRGFLTGLILSDRLKLPFIPVRKKNKLPGNLLSVSYKTEYSEDIFQIQADVLNENSKVLIVDDLLATGGSLKAAEDLVELAGGEVSGYFISFTIGVLKGKEKLKKPDRLIDIMII